MNSAEGIFDGLTDEQLEAIAGGRLWNKCGELGPDPNCQTVCS